MLLIIIYGVCESKGKNFPFCQPIVCNVIDEDLKYKLKKEQAEKLKTRGYEMLLCDIVDVTKASAVQFFKTGIFTSDLNETKYFFEN